MGILSGLMGNAAETDIESVKKVCHSKRGMAFGSLVSRQSILWQNFSS